MNTFYAVHTPFTGVCQTIGHGETIDSIESVSYYTGTPSEYEAEQVKKGQPITWVTYDSFDSLLDTFHYEQYLARPAVSITREEYWDMLEVLPPEDYKRVGPVTSFLMSEYTTGLITTQYAECSDEYLCKSVHVLQPETFITLGTFHAMREKKERALIGFFELSPDWQAIATSNLDDCAEEATYIEPCTHHVPDTHVLYDLMECMPGVEPNTGIIGISNNSALRLHFDADMESCTLEYV